MATKTRWSIGNETESNHALIRVDIETGGDHLRATKKRLQYRTSEWDVVKVIVTAAVKRTEEEWKRAKDSKDHEEMANLLEEILKEGIYEGTPVERASWRSKKWFDEEVSEKRKEMVKMKRWRKGRLDQQRGEEDNKWKKKRNKYFRVVREKKKKMWDKCVEEAETNEAMWEVWRTTKKNRFAKTPMLKEGEERAVTFEKKE